MGSHFMKSISLALCATLFVGCSGDNSFSGKPPSSSKNDDVVPVIATPGETPSEPTEPSKNEEDFIVGTNQPQVDMLWVVDNSGSMTPHIANVRKNFANFLTKIELINNLNFVLYSSPEKNMGQVSGSGSLGLSLPVQFENKERFKHIPQRVGSYDILYLVAEALCPKAGAFKKSSAGQKISLCERTYDPEAFRSADEQKGFSLPESTTLNRGDVSKLFRKDSVKIVVFVSDENSFGVNAKLFAQYLKDEALNLKIFAFTGQKKDSTPSCPIFFKGQAYIDLAQQFSGKTFNLCDRDWSPNFDTLTKETNDIAQSNFTLKNFQTEVASVSISGKELNSGEYSISGSLLTLLKAPAAGERVKVKYK